jgi:hypothetical protein
MICRYCAAEIPDGSQFCIKCGAPLGTVWNAPPLGGTAFPQTPMEPFSEAKKTSGKAIASLVCGCLFFLFPVPIVAIVLGHVALSEIRRSAGRLKGEGLAVTGLVLGYASTALVGLFLILVLISIPKAMKLGNTVANDGNAIATLRTYNEKTSAYAKLCPDRGYPESTANLGPGNGDCEHANLVSQALSSRTPQVSGYVFFYRGIRDRAGHTTRYTINADPYQFGRKGLRHFYTDESGVIRYAIDQPADIHSQPLQAAPGDGDDDDDDEGDSSGTQKH